MKTDDHKIWEDFKSGDDNALSYIYHQHVQLLYRYGKKFSKDDDLVKDTIQDLFFDLIRTRGNLGETNSIKFYLLASFRRKLVRNIQKQPSLEEIQENTQLNAEIIYSFEENISGIKELTHREIMIKKALKGLSPRQREIIFYRFTCEFDYDQICELMSLKYDSARKTLSRALKVLQKLLAKSGFF